MDPDAAFNELLDAIADEDWDTIEDRAQALLDWTGFRPGGDRIKTEVLVRFLMWARWRAKAGEE